MEKNSETAIADDDCIIIEDDLTTFYGETDV